MPNMLSFMCCTLKRTLHLWRQLVFMNSFKVNHSLCTVTVFMYNYLSLKRSGALSVLLPHRTFSFIAHMQLKKRSVQRGKIDVDNHMILSDTTWKRCQISLNILEEDIQHKFECALGYVPELTDPVYMKPIPLHAYNPHFDISYMPIGMSC